MRSTILVWGPLVLFMLVGCSYVYHPIELDKFDMAVSKGATKKSLSKPAPFAHDCSVSFVNKAPDIGEQLIYKNGPHKNFADYHEWTEFFITEWGKQLKKLGCTVSDKSQNEIGVSLSGFGFEQGFWLIKSNVSVELDAPSRGFHHAYDGYARRGGLDFSAAVYQTIAQLLRDPEVRKLLETH